MKTYKIHLLRHGLTDANEQGLYIGRTNLPLSPEGLLSLQRMKEVFTYPGAGRFFCAAQSRQMRSEKRAVAYRAQSDLPQLVLEQLLDGPTLQNLVSPIPRGTRCVDVTLTDGVCSVVLSEEFTACDTDEASAALAVRALAATLCELPDVQSVRLSVIGVQDLTYFSIAEPLAPTDDWFT